MKSETQINIIGMRRCEACANFFNISKTGEGFCIEKGIFTLKDYRCPKFRIEPYHCSDCRKMSDPEVNKEGENIRWCLAHSWGEITTPDKIACQEFTKDKRRMEAKKLKKAGFIVGIDPDADKNGVALLDTKTRKFELKNLDFYDTINFISEAKKSCDEKNERIIIAIEAGWINQSNWHIQRGDSTALAAAKGRNTGMNHQTGILLHQVISRKGIECVLIKPLRKIWKKGKISNEEIKRITGIEGRNNQEERDAALIAWVMADFPAKFE